jgi:hypothetical protein
MRHLQMEQIDGYRPTTAEKAMFGLKISCALLGATGPIASGLNLFGSTMINGSLSTSAQLTSNISSGIAAVNNGTNLVYKHARHESEIESTKLLKRTTSTETVSNAMDLTSGLQFHKKTLRWSDLHPPRNKAIFSSKPSETAARTI